MDAAKKTTTNKDLAAWVHAYADDLYRWACYQLRDNDLAHDLVQETFLSAVRHVDQFKGDSSAKTWLFSILRRKLIDHFRKSANMKLESLTMDGDTAHDSFDDAGNWKSDQRPTPWPSEDEHLLDNPEFAIVLSNCLERLPANWSSCVHMRYLTQNETEEICQQLSISPSNLWQILHRAKAQLRQCLEKNWFQK